VDDVIGRYIVHIKNSFPKELTLKGIRVVLDTANGAAYKVAPTIFTELGADVVVINNTPNGSNINLNCGAMHPELLGENVRKLRADVGFAFDGDADRLVVVDENGDKIDGDKLLGKLAVYLNTQNKLKGCSMCATVMSNKALEDYLNENEISLFRSNVGDKYVLDILNQKGLNFGGEQSGHVILSDYVKTGDALISSLAVMACFLSEKKPISELFNPFDLHPQFQKNLAVTNKVPLDMIDGFPPLVEKIEKEGIRVLIRYSGTENLLRILLEGKDEKTLENYMSEVYTFLKKALND
jgi:phosphoglucosamine mutase